MQHDNHFAYASPWKRLGALLLDFLIIGIASLILGFVIGSMVSPRTAASPEFESRLNGLGLLISWMYYAYMESSAKQATIGKSLMRLVVTDLNGDRVTFARATGRFFGHILSGVFLGIGYFIAFFTEKRQALHDIMAGCLVLDAQSDTNASIVRESSQLQEARNSAANTSSQASPAIPAHVRQQPVVIDEDAIYASIAAELETGVTDKALWTRLFAQFDGDENKTKAAYIKHRATALIAEKRAELAAATPPPESVAPAVVTPVKASVAEQRPVAAVKVAPKPTTKTQYQSWAHELAAAEIDNLKVDQALWGQVLTAFNGDKNAAKFEYIQRRAEAITAEEKHGTLPLQRQISSQSETASLKSQDDSDDDVIRKLVMQEFATGLEDKALWASIFKDSDGDQNKAKSTYIEKRTSNLVAKKRADEVLKAEKLQLSKMMREERDLAKLDQFVSQNVAMSFLNRVRSNQLDQVEKMLQDNPLLAYVTNSEGDTSLHIAVKEFLPAMARFLVESGALIDHVNSSGETPLSLANASSEWELVDILLGKA